MLGTLSCGSAGAGDPVRTEDHVLLKSGNVLAGRVTGTEFKAGRPILVVETAFGVMRIPKSATKRSHRSDVDHEETLRMGRVKVVRIEGKVERKPQGGTEWLPVSWRDRYEEPIVNAPNAIIRQGDTIRTGADGTLDFQPNRHVWIRIGRSSEVVIPAAEDIDADSVELKRGRALLDIHGHPRGQTFRVRTPLQTLSSRDALAEIERDRLHFPTQSALGATLR